MTLSPENNEINGFKESLSVMDQLQKVKSYFIKVDKEFHPEKYEKKKVEKHQMINPPKNPVKRIIERTVESNQKILEKQAKKSDAKKAGRNAKDFMSSSSDGETKEPETLVDSLLKKRKQPLEKEKTSSKLTDRMHGATVVPEPAFLKYKKYISK